VIRTTPHIERQFAACLPHTFPASPATGAIVENPPGATSQTRVSETLPSGNYLVATVNGSAILFDIFDPQLNLVSETSFAPAPANPAYPNNFETLKLADLNGDGKLDLIALSEATVPFSEYTSLAGTIWTFLGNGDGTFQAGVSLSVFSLYELTNSASFAVGDVNGDKKPDVVLVVGSYQSPGAFFSLLGNGDGTFTLGQNSVGQTSSFPQGPYGSLALADVNGDGKLDLILAGGTYPTGYPWIVAVALGNGNGTFQTASTFPALDGSVAIGDMNGDGFPDIVTSGGSILFGDGKGGFPTRHDYALPSASVTLDDDSAPPPVTLGDFDGDGYIDIIVGVGNPGFLSGSSTNPTATVLFGNGGGTFTDAPVSFAAISSVNAFPQSIVTADFDGDGIADLAVTNIDSVTVLKGIGSGEFSQVAQYSYSPGAPYSIVTADFNGDGRPDLAVLVYLGNSQEVQIFPGNGDGTFGAPTSLAFPATGSIVPGALATGDLNGDGIPDLVVAAYNSVWVSLGQKGGTFSAPISDAIPAGSLATVALGDFNGDGKVDIAVANTGAQNVTLLIGKGDGTFSMGSVTPLAASVPNGAGTLQLGPIVLIAGDFNGDGKLDLAVSLGENGSPDGGGYFTILLGRGDGTFQPTVLSSQDIGSMAVADLNGDGIPDLAIGGYFSAGTTAFLGNGDGTFQPGVQILPVSLQSIAVADFNRDGKLDLAGGLMSFGVVTLLNLSQPPAPLTIVSAASFAAGPLAPDSIASGFGRGLSAVTVSSNPPPTTLGGITVTVEDSAGASRLAPLFLVSPGQINFLVPAATAAGPATITVAGGGGKPVSATASIAPAAPSLFTEGTAGIAAAYVTTVAPDGTQTTEFVFTSQSGSIAAAPIDVTAPGQVYLILFGTGFDSVSASSASVTVQGVPGKVTYAGPQSQVAGLDQVNVLLPPSVAGTGLASVVLTVGGTAANTVYVTIQ
jgi:uncharacterized protein (TIGR03437 family)